MRRAAVSLKLAFAHCHRSRMATIPPAYGSERAAAMVAALINLLAIGTKFRHATQCGLRSCSRGPALVSHLPRVVMVAVDWDCGSNCPLQRKRDRFAPSEVPNHDGSLSPHGPYHRLFWCLQTARAPASHSSFRPRRQCRRRTHWARVKRIDAVFIPFEDASTELCEQFAALGVRPIIVTAEDATGVASTSTSWRSVLGSQPAGGVSVVFHEKSPRPA